jgi:hypothetical protein
MPAIKQASGQIKIHACKTYVRRGKKNPAPPVVVDDVLGMTLFLFFNFQYTRLLPLVIVLILH